MKRSPGLQAESIFYCKGNMAVLFLLVFIVQGKDKM